MSQSSTDGAWPLRMRWLAAVGVVMVVVGAVGWYTVASGNDDDSDSPATSILVDNDNTGDVYSDLREWHGRLQVDADGCVTYAAAPGGDSHVIVWPAGTTTTGSGSAITIKSGGQTFQLGDAIVFEKSYSQHAAPSGCTGDGDKVFIRDVDHEAVSPAAPPG